MSKITFIKLLCWGFFCGWLMGLTELNKYKNNQQCVSWDKGDCIAWVRKIKL